MLLYEKAGGATAAGTNEERRKQKKNVRKQNTSGSIEIIEFGETIQTPSTYIHLYRPVTIVHKKKTSHRQYLLFVTAVTLVGGRDL